MSKQKKQIRQKFRNVVYDRDQHQCMICNLAGVKLDAHHITDRSLMPNGGYVLENGITLCEPCHKKAECYDSDNAFANKNFDPKTLYDLIGSTYELAVKKSTIC